MQQSDVTVGTIVMATSRLALMDFAEGYTYTTIVVVIPMPQPTANVAAIIEPFQIPVIHSCHYDLNSLLISSVFL